MKIIDMEIIRGNDFKGKLECEHCGNVEKLSNGYNDNYYHTKVIPGRHCKKCGKNRSGELKKPVED